MSGGRSGDPQPPQTPSRLVHRPGPQTAQDAGLPSARHTRLPSAHHAGRALLWAAAAGVIFALLNTSMRVLSQALDPFQTQFLRYLCGLLVMLPLMLRSGFMAWRPRSVGGQMWRGAVHTIGLLLWFTALPHIPLADMTAIGFTTPIFIMIGAVLFLGEPMRWERWVAALLGFAGVVIVLGPKLAGGGGWYNLVMLASAPVFAGSFLITKALTRHDTPEVIVAWQSLTVALFSLPFALLHWTWPDPLQWGWFLVCGVLGSAGHYCLTESFRTADISATQSARFLDLVWASLMGWLVFADVPTQSALVGGAVTLAATVWIARREARAAPGATARPGWTRSRPPR